MKPCPKCLQMVPQESRFCLNCGAQMQQARSFNYGILIFGVLCFVAFLSALGKQHTNVSETSDKNAQAPQQIATASDQAQDIAPETVVGVSGWNGAENTTVIKNSFAEIVKYLDSDDAKHQALFRGLYKKFVESTNKEDLRKLSKETLAAETTIKKSSLTRAAKDLFLDDLNIAKTGLDERITHLGDPTTGLATTTEIPMPPEPVTVEYEIITGPHMKWSATYENEQGGTEQITDGVGRWKKKIQVPPGSYLSLSVQNGEDFGHIYVYITVNGDTAKRSEASGGYCIASASYQVPD